MYIFKQSSKKIFVKQCEILDGAEVQSKQNMWKVEK